jgi:hypothetical protein
LPAEERNQLMAAGEELDEERAVELAVAIV